MKRAINEDFKRAVSKWKPFCKRLTIDYLPRRVIKPNQTCYILRNSLQLINPKMSSLNIRCTWCYDSAKNSYQSDVGAYHMLHVKKIKPIQDGFKVIGKNFCRTSGQLPIITFTKFIEKNYPSGAFSNWISFLLIGVFRISLGWILSIIRLNSTWTFFSERWLLTFSCSWWHLQQVFKSIFWQKLWN